MIATACAIRIDGIRATKYEYDFKHTCKHLMLFNLIMEFFFWALTPPKLAIKYFYSGSECLFNAPRKNLEELKEAFPAWFNGNNNEITAAAKEIVPVRIIFDLPNPGKPLVQVEEESIIVSIALDSGLELLFGDNQHLQRQCLLIVFIYLSIVLAFLFLSLISIFIFIFYYKNKVYSKIQEKIVLKKKAANTKKGLIRNLFVKKKKNWTLAASSRWSRESFKYWKRHAFKIY